MLTKATSPTVEKKNKNYTSTRRGRARGRLLANIYIHKQLYKVKRISHGK